MIIKLILTIAILLAGVVPSLAGGIMMMGGGTPATASFPLTSSLDDFNRSNEGPPPSTHWTCVTNGAKVVDNTLAGDNAASNICYWEDISSTDQEAYVTYTTSDSGFGVFVRTSTVTFNGYSVVYDSALGKVKIQKLTGGSPTGLQEITQTVSAGDSIGASIKGTAIKAYYKASGGSWAQIGTTQTDSSYADAGVLGVIVTGTTARLDNFGGGSW